MLTLCDEIHRARISVTVKAPASEETLLRKHCSPECFLGVQSRGIHCFLAMQTKKHFTENRRLGMLNLGNTAYASTKFSQTGKHLLRKQHVSEKRALREHVSSTMFPQQCFLVPGGL